MPALVVWMIKAVIYALILGMLSFSVANAKGLYGFVDDDGKVHFSNDPRNDPRFKLIDSSRKTRSKKSNTVEDSDFPTAQEQNYTIRIHVKEGSVDIVLDCDSPCYSLARIIGQAKDGKWDFRNKTPMVDTYTTERGVGISLCIDKNNGCHWHDTTTLFMNIVDGTVNILGGSIRGKIISGMPMLRRMVIHNSKSPVYFIEVIK